MDLYWQKGVPFSRDFGDIYYSTENGLAEARHVFIEGNRLPQRWVSQAESRGRQCFRLCELGFGTGLNFCAACNAFMQYAPPDMHLNYISCEKYPLSSKQIQTALSLFPEIAVYWEELLLNYAPYFPGQWQRWRLCAGRVSLALYFGEAAAMCREITRPIHAWFLDGFAPAKNPEMWTKDIFQNMARLSQSRTSCTSFSVAGYVRRGLQAVGFQTRRLAGFGNKRQMLFAEWTLQKRRAREAEGCI